MKAKTNRLALRVSLIYCLVAGLWILLSDRALVALVSDPQTIGKIAVFKGWAFVVVTALLLFFMLRNQLRRWEQEAAARRQSQDALQEREEQLLLYTEHSPAAIAMFDRDMKYLVVSRRWMDDYHLGDQPIVGRSHYEVFPEVPKRWVEIHRRCLAGAVEKCDEDAFPLGDGTIHWIRWEVRPWYKADGSIGGIIIFSEDITERRRKDEALRESEHNYRSLFKNMLNGFAFCRMHFDGDRPLDFTYLKVNPAFEALTGLKNVEGRKASEVMHGIREADPTLFERYGRVARTGVPERFDIYVEVLKMWFAIAVYSPKKDHFVAVFDVITERKRVEDELLWKSAFLEAQVDSALDGILVVDSRGRKILQNQRLNELWKIPPHIAEDKDDAPQVKFVASRVKNPDPRLFTDKIVHLMSHPDEVSRDEIEVVDGTFLDRYSSPVRDKAGKYYGRIWTFRDITEKRKLEAQFRQTQKMESIGKLAGGVAHDFNNILAVIQLQADLLKTEETLSPTQLDYAGEIGAATQRAAALTRQLLMFSRRQTMQPHDLDLTQSINDITKMLRRTLGEEIQLQFKFAMQSLFIHADAGMLDQVLMNLAVNARDAMPKGGRLIIETSAVEIDAAAAAHNPPDRSGSFVCLSVSDTGCGIPPEILPRIFEPFFTTKDVGKGTGLGLATVFGIVQQHQGWVRVYSEAGRGSTFRIYLPRLAAMTPQKSGQPASDFPRGGNEMILLVEDDAFMRASVFKALSKLGYGVLEAASGVEALEVWKQGRDKIHLLLTDLVMPGGINGKELGQQLLQEKPGLKVIYASGYSTEVAGRDFSLEEGVNFLAKPFEASKLAQTVRNCLDGI
jgi:PAS domain S-box-containing protein